VNWTLGQGWFAGQGVTRPPRTSRANLERSEHRGLHRPGSTTDEIVALANTFNPPA
jgi:hypothetical protein